MSDRSRFCVQFAGSQAHCAKKTRLLYNDSKPDDIRDIWKLIYDTSDAPQDIEIVAGNHATYLVNDPEDFEVFVAMAEDQYRLFPAKPLSVIICLPGEYRPSPSLGTSSPDRSLPPIQYEAKMNGYCKMIEKGSDIFTNGSKPFLCDNSAAASRESSPQHHYTSRSPAPITNGHVGKMNGLSPQDLSSHRHLDRPDQKFQAIDFSRSRPSGDSPVQPQPIRFNANGGTNGHTDNGFQPCSSASATNSVSTIVNNLQQQRLLQNSPSASYILQTFLRNNFERAAAMQFGNGVGLSSSVDGKPDSILASTLNDFRALQESNSLLPKEFDTKKRKRRNFNKNNLQIGGRVGRVLDTSKRMRSSPTQSNIEYHYERAVEYHTMTEEEQKSHNSAHRSHWKHLLFVSQSSPNFLRNFRNAKYDEWSSEARDIFAISKPDKYKWSFLTLSKQGDVLCRRIIERVKDLKQLKLEDRPEWCPTDEVLEIAQHRAAERLAQLERILYSRSQSVLQDENNKNDRKSDNTKPLSFNVPSLATALGQAFSLPHNLTPRISEFAKPVDRSTAPTFTSIKHESISPEETC